MFFISLSMNFTRVVRKCIKLTLKVKSMSKIVLTFLIFFVSIILVSKENVFETLWFVKLGACESQ